MRALRVFALGLCLAGLAVLAGAPGCGPPPRGGESIDAPRWPYAGVTSSTRTPPELQGRVRYRGSWIESDPTGRYSLTETGDSRYVVRVPFDSPRSPWFLDLGLGAEVEAIDFLDGGRTAVFVAAVSSPHHGRALFARSLLVVDIEQGLLLDSFPLTKGGRTRGFAVDPYDRVAFILTDPGAGSGVVESVDLYRGNRLARRRVGAVPSRLGRKGLAVGRDARKVFCVAGGETARGDFDPVDEAEPTGPQLIVLDSDSLTVTGRIALDARFDPEVVRYDARRDRVYVLATRPRQSRIWIVDAAFESGRTWVDLPEATSDLVLGDGYAFAPGANGIYIVDLNLESWVSRSDLPFDFTGEMTVSGDQRVAYVLFQTARVGGGPGIAAVDLVTGNLIEVLQ